MSFHKWKETIGSNYKAECVIYHSYPELGILGQITSNGSLFKLVIFDSRDQIVFSEEDNIDPEMAKKRFDNYISNNWKKNSKFITDNWIEIGKNLEAAFASSKAFKGAPTTGEISRFKSETSWRIVSKDRDQNGAISLSYGFDGFRFSVVISVDWFRSHHLDFASHGSNSHYVNLSKTTSDPVELVLQYLENMEKLPETQIGSIGSAW